MCYLPVSSEVNGEAVARWLLLFVYIGTRSYYQDDYWWTQNMKEPQNITTPGETYLFQWKQIYISDSITTDMLHGLAV